MLLAPAWSQAQVLLRNNISGAPVVDPYDGDSSGSGKLVGVLSEEDLLWKEVEATDKVSHNPTPSALSQAPLPQLSHKPHSLSIVTPLSAVTTPGIITSGSMPW